MSNPRTPPTGRTGRPPPLRLSDASATSDLPEGAVSIYEPVNLLSSASADLPIIDASALSPAPATPRAVPVTRRRPSRPSRLASEAGQEEPLPAAVELPIGHAPPPTDGPWTVDEAGPAPVVVTRSVARAPVGRSIVRNVEPPPPRRKVTVEIRSKQPANAEELSWVIWGDTRMGVVADPEGKPRLVAVYIAFIVRSFSLDADNPVVYVDMRWHGMPAKMEKGWMRKLRVTNDGERLRQFKESLEYFFGFAEPRIGLVPHYLGGPATTEQAVVNGEYQWSAEGCPGVKFGTNLLQVGAASREARQFYQQRSNSPFIGLRRALWRKFWPAEEAKYLLGEKYDTEGLPKPQVSDGLTRNDRLSMLSRVAQIAGPAVSSFGKIAWSEDPDVLVAMDNKGQKPVEGTMYTRYEPGAEG